MIRLKDVEMEYDNGTRAIKGISLTIEDGEFVFLVGPSGSGKSTIIKLLTGEVEPCAGRIMINGFSVSNISEKQIPLMRRTLGVIFQDFRLIEKKTVYDNLAFVMRAVGASPKEIRKRIPYVLDVMTRMKKAVGDTTALYGLICGPFTLASHLRGNNLFTDMFDFEEETASLFAFCTRVCKKMADYYIEAGMDVIALVDPLISQISTAHFEQYMTEPYTELFTFIREKGAFSSFFVCGDATRNIEVMCQTGPDSISVDENVDLLAAKAISDKYNVVIGGNIPLTSIMLLGNQQDNMKFAIDLLDSIPVKKNFILAPGCDMPYDVPVENCIGIAQAAIEPDAVREMVKNYQAEEIDTSNVVLPDYANLKKPLVEVFTLDSAQCAACGYMMGAANAAKETFGDAIDMVEYKYIYKENVARCVKMGVPNLPSMYINGELKYRSIIPTKAELEASIREAIEACKG